LGLLTRPYGSNSPYIGFSSSHKMGIESATFS
jgi:hypothetical protein